MVHPALLRRGRSGISSIRGSVRATASVECYCGRREATRDGDGGGESGGGGDGRQNPPARGAASRVPVPEPCTACGRREQPERLHSHPPASGARGAANARGLGPGAQRSPLRSPALPRRTRVGMAGAGAGEGANAAPKSSVRKPLALKFRSGGGDSPHAQARAAPPAAPPAAPAPGPAPAPAPTASAVPPPAAPAGAKTSGGGRPALLLCYLCGREFGRASLPLHEPHCLQRWHRENEALPPALRRSPPQRPAPDASSDAAAPALAAAEWNRLAWEAAQSRLVPCGRCGRTFAPDRLPVHERACKAPAPTPAPAPTAASAPAATAPAQQPAQRGVPCPTCGRLFGSASIAIHVPQCAAKQDASAPPPQLPPGALPFQGAGGHGLASSAPASASARGVGAGAGVRGRGRGRGRPRGRGPSSASAPAAASLAVPASAVAPAPAAAPARGRWRGPGAVGPTSGSGGGAGATWAPRRAPLCYLCGRPFGAASLPIHERSCLQRWRRENAQLPPHLQRPEPEKPCVVYREDGSMDMEGTMEAIWQSHLQQLVPCSHCGRTFNPDRLEVHQRACKGPRR